jgi:hypothetical protein
MTEFGGVPDFVQVSTTHSSYRPPSRYPWLWLWHGSVAYGCRIKSGMTGVKSYRPASRYRWVWQWRGSVAYGCRIKSGMTGCGVVPASEPESTVVAVAWFRGLWMPDQVRHDRVWGRTGLRAGIHYPFVIPAPEPVSMVVAVAWFSGMWMPDQVRHDGV